MNLDPLQIDELFEPWNRSDSPGCALGIVHAGELIYARGYGMADLEHGAPITPSSVFDIASISKQFTAWCVLLLAHHGRLGLDDSVHHYIGELPDYGVPITIRHLLHHTSGLRDYLALMDLASKPDHNHYSAKDIYALIARQQALNFRPGSEYLYSNTGYLLLGEIVRRVAGCTLREYAAEHIFEPLGMTKTHFHDDFREIVPARAVGHRVGDQGDFQLDLSPFDLVGDGAVYTTVEDLARWDRVFYETPLEGGQALAAQMLLTTGEKTEYACGLIHGVYRGLPTVGHDGAWVGYRATLLRFPDQRFTVICLANLATIDPSLLSLKVADICLGNLFPEPSANMRARRAERGSMETLSQRAGLYINDLGDDIWTLNWTDGSLTLDWEYGGPTPLIPMQDQASITDDAAITIRFVDLAAGRPQAFDAQVLGGRLRRFTRLEAEAVSFEQLSTLVGAYASEELGASFHVTVADGSLWLHRPRNRVTVLDPITPALFRMADYLVHFSLDGHGQTDAMCISGSGLRNLRFVRQPDRSV